MPVRTGERPVQALGAGFGDEFRGLAQHVQARCIAHLAPAVGADGQRHAAQHELRVQPVAALFQVTAIGHLADHVRGADQVSQDPILGIGHDDAVEGHFVAGEMNDFTGHRCPAGQLDPGQVVGQELGAARHVDPGELCAVLVVPVVLAAQVAHIMEQTDDQSGRGALGAQLLRRRPAAIVSRHQAGQRQRHVKGVLPVVIDGVDAVIVGHITGEHAIKLIECAGDRLEREVLPGAVAEFLDSLANGRRGTHLHRARYVEVVQPRHSLSVIAFGSRLVPQSRHAHPG